MLSTKVFEINKNMNMTLKYINLYRSIISKMKKKALRHNTASSMFRSVKNFVMLAKKNKSKNYFTHCLLYQEVLA